ncbi:MAG: aminotransferase class V-fold PLP-dependent enzyme [Desulforhabdus sp.]|jgi:selenocysteine lyase/cysteine desulfurase|nr:aminotransferase class V-fold PLP-dependent enzyme [Desulforhabdus sp.]
MFDKSSDLFPVKNNYIYLAHCGVSPLYSGALRKELEIARAQCDTGALAFKRYEDYLDELRSAAARLFKTSPENLAFVKNTTEGLSLIANGYPFEKGDRIISYVHEYPANHYPWKLQELRGVELVLLPDRGDLCRSAEGRPCSWSMADLEQLVDNKTRLIALSHVQFTSGFAADLKELGELCRSRGIDLVVDAAQSLGCLPLYPEEYNISAVASSGWKCLLGPVGTGLLYTSQPFRERLGHVLVGAEVMRQGTEYLDHRWQPHHSARRFEYSTSPISLAAGLKACIEEIPLRYEPENIRTEVFRLQDIILRTLDRDRFTPVEFQPEHRSGILSLICRDDPDAIAKVLEKQGVICSCRGGYLRLAPHFYISDEEIKRAVSILNSVEV